MYPSQNNPLNQPSEDDSMGTKSSSDGLNHVAPVGGFPSPQTNSNPSDTPLPQYTQGVHDDLNNISGSSSLGSVSDSTQTDDTTSLDESDISVDVDIDIVSLLQKTTPDNVDSLIRKLEQSGNTNQIELADILKGFDRSIFELSPSEEQLRELHSALKAKGIPDDIATGLIAEIVSAVHERMVLTVVGAMNEESRRAWDSLQIHSPNPVQQMYLLEVTADQLIGKSLDEIYNEELGKLINTVKSLLDIQEKNTSLARNLTEDQSKHIKKVFDQGEHEVAIQLIYQFAKENGNN